MRITSIGLALLRFASSGVRDSLSFEGVEADGPRPHRHSRGRLYELMRGDSLVTRAPTSVVLIRNRGRWSTLKDHVS